MNEKRIVGQQFKSHATVSEIKCGLYTAPLSFSIRMLGCKYREEHVPLVTDKLALKQRGFKTAAKHCLQGEE